MSAIVGQLRTELDAILVVVRGPIAETRRAVYADWSDAPAQAHLGQLTAAHSRAVLALNDTIDAALARSLTMAPEAVEWLERVAAALPNLLAAGSADGPDTCAAALGFFEASLADADHVLAAGGTPS